MSALRQTYKQAEEEHVATLVPDEAAKKAPVKFCEQVTGYHFIKDASRSDDEEGPHFPIDTVAVVLSDRGTRWLAVYLEATKTCYHTVEAMQHFCGPKDRIASFYCDNAPELVTSARACRWRIATATPGMPQANGVAERSVTTC